MPDKNDNLDPIEEFFRRRVWDFDISYDETDWMDLEDRLDILDRQHTQNHIIRWVAAAVILVFFALGYFTYQNYTKLNKISEQVNSDANIELKNGKTGKLSDRGVAGATEEGESEDTAINGLPPDKQNDAIPSKSSNESALNLLFYSQLLAESSVGGIDKQASKNTGDWNNTDTPLFVSELSCEECYASSRALQNRSLSSLQTDLSNTGTNTIMLASAGNQKSSLSLSHVNGTDPQTTSKISVGLVVSPDMSTVGSSSNFSTLGYRTGINVEYKLAKNLAITTGIIASKVNYKAGRDDYSLPQGYWTNDIAASSTSATCVLLDIPVTLKYDFLSFDQSRFFASAGLSSYIMLNEEYRFNYDYPQPGLVQEWDEKTGTRHWMSNASISLGYEFDVNDHWSIRAEPYVKLPVREVGWANVNLLSTGSFISINYNL